MSVPSTPPSHAMMFFGSTMPEIYLDQIDPTSVALTQNMELSVEQTSSLLKYALLKVERENIEKVPSPAHKFCRHRGACSASAWRGFLKGATVGLGVKCSMSVLSALIFGKIFRKCQIFRPRAVLRTIVSLDMARFGAFTALFLGGFRGCQCILRRVRRKDDRWNAFVAGWVAGLAIICDVRHRRKSLSIFMLVRSIAFGVQLLVANGRYRRAYGEGRACECSQRESEGISGRMVSLAQDSGVTVRTSEIVALRSASPEDISMYGERAQTNSVLLPGVPTGVYPSSRPSADFISIQSAQNEQSAFDPSTPSKVHFALDLFHGGISGDLLGSFLRNAKHLTARQQTDVPDKWIHVRKFDFY
eukprot:222090_1